MRIELSNVDVDFPIYDARTRSLKHRVLGLGPPRLGAARLGSAGHSRVLVHALRAITLSLGNGDRLGLVGRNGAGKSTLLRVMSGIYEPVAGSVRVTGRIASLTNLTMGMDMEGTGYENIVIRGLMLGMTRRQSLERVEDIESFTELGDYLSLPLRTYSAGMLVRLAFAISTTIDPEILIMDEMIGAGDKAFAIKASERLERMMAAANILVVASHSNETLRRLCNKAALLREGRLIAVGSVDEIVKRYEAEG
jgi:ABC-2 type transport system ATP-binding protein